MKSTKRLLIVLLSLMMVFTTIPASVGMAFAEDGTDEGLVDVQEGIADQTEGQSDAEPTDGSENETPNVQGQNEPVQVELVQEEETPEVRTVSDGDVSISVNLVRGYTEVRDGNYVWVPGWDGDQIGSAASHAFQYELVWSIDSEKAGDYEPGTIQVKIPKRILYHFEFDENGDPIMEDGKIKRVPDATMCTLGLSTSAQGTFTYREEGDYIIIYNQEIPTEQNFSCQVSYRTEKPTFNYLDYDPGDLDYCGSDAVPAVYTTQARGEDEVVLTETAPRVFIETSATLIDDYTGERTANQIIYNNDYNHPFASRKTMSSHWSGGQGVNYMRFLIEVTFKSPVTQAYNLKISDNPRDYYAGTAQDCNLRIEGYKFETDPLNEGNTTSGYTQNNEVHGLTADKMYVYVLIAADAPSVNANVAQYKISNTETTDVDSACGVDEHQNRSCTFGPWQWGFNVIVPEGHFMLLKWGNNNWQAAAHTEAVMSNGEKTKYPIASYDLHKFQEAMENGDAELPNISFFLQWYGFQYPWTRSNTNSNDLSVYGQKDVQWTFTDDTVKLEGTELSAGDYYVDSVDLHVASHNRFWNPDAGKWDYMSQTGPECYGENNYYDLYVEIDGNYEWAAKVQWRGKAYDELAAASVECDESIVTVTKGLWVFDRGGQIRGYIFKFPNKNVTGYKFVTQNRNYQHYAYTRANYTLLSSDRVKNLVSGKQRVELENTADVFTKEYDLTTGTWKNGYIYHALTDSTENCTAIDYIEGEQRSLHLDKTALSGENDTTNRYYRTSWFMHSREHLDSGSANPVTTENNRGDWVQQQLGVFYDLLPRGTTLIPDSVKVYSVYTDDNAQLVGSVDKQDRYAQYLLDPSKYTVEEMPNYKGERGYTLVKITINEESLDVKTGMTYIVSQTPTATSYTSGTFYPGYTVKFDTATSWEALDDYGSFLYNSAAYKTGNTDEIIQVGTTGDTTTGSALQNLPSSMKDKSTVLRLMSNLEYAPNENAPKIFTYAYGGHEAIYDTASSSGLSKAVKGENDLVAGSETEVDPSGKYSYRLRYSAGATTQLTNVVMYDNIETFVDEAAGKVPLWRGTPLGISFEVADATNFRPVVYLSGQDVDFSQYNANNLPDLTDTSIWTKYEDPSAITENIMKDVKSIAVDFGSYAVKPYKSVNVWIDMQAPSSNETNVVKPPTYNIMRASAVKSLPTGDEHYLPSPGTRAGGTPDFTVSRETKVSYELKGLVKIQKVDDLGEPIEGVQFDLTGTSKFGDEVDLTGTTDEYGYLTFEDLDISGTEGYTLTEVVPQGYITEGNTWTAIVNTDGSSTVNGEDSSTGYYVITNREETTAYADKKWLGINGDTNPPAEATIEFTLYADGTATNHKVTLDGTEETTVPATAGGYESAPWRATFVHLPKYKNVNGVVTPITYTVKETAGWTGYTPSTADGVQSGGYITNTLVSTELSVTKAWQNADGTNTPPENAEVTFTLYADGSETSHTVTLDGTPDTAAPTAAGGYESEAWKASFVNLPKYEDVNGTETEIEYTVVETGTWPGYTVSYGDHGETFAVNGGVIKNSRKTTELYVIKAWQNADGSSEAPDNANVTFTLFADGEDTGLTCELNGSADTAVPEHMGAYESEAWKASFVNLPECNVVNGTETDIEYTVKETGTWPGYTVSYEGTDTTYAVNEGVITNTQEVTSLSVTKAWKNADGTTTAPNGAQVTFTLYADGQDTGFSVTLRGVEDSEPIMQGGEESAPWKASFVRMPKYRINEKDDLVEIEYTVKETGTWPGYTVSYGDHDETFAVDGGVITNTEIAGKGELKATKILDPWHDGNTFTFVLSPVDGAPMPKDANGGEQAEVSKTVTKDDPTALFGEITYTSTGTYTYNITEVVPDNAENADGVRYSDATDEQKAAGGFALNGVTYDSTVHTATVTVSQNDSDPALLDVAVKYDGKEAEAAEITNTYKAEGKLTLEGTKTLVGRDMTENDIFTFEVKDNESGKVWEASNDNTGKISYPTIEYTYDPENNVDETGSYSYTVTETSTDADGITVATNTYDVSVKVEDNGDGTLKITPSDNYNALDFVNTYKATGKITFEGVKTITGREMTENDIFTFEITEVDTENVWTVENNAEGTIGYPEIEYTLDLANNVDDTGVHNYVVKETSTDGNGITVDTTEYTVSVEVTDNGDGTLSVVTMEASDDPTKLDFDNPYDATGSITFEGTKTLKGRALTKDDVFTFTVTEKGTDNTWTATNDETGKISYPVIEYGLEDIGTHTYTVKETSKDGKNIKVDKTVYTVKVEVSDNGDGTLSVKGDKNCNALNFVNTYENEEPPTGDSTNVMGYMFALSVSLLGLLVLIRRRKTNE